MSTYWTLTSLASYMEYFMVPAGKNKKNVMGNLLPPTHYLGYIGALVAFLMPQFGALACIEDALTYLKDGQDDFNTEYVNSSLDGKTSVAIIQLAFWYFTTGQGVFTVVSFLHAAFVSFMGYVFGNMVMGNLQPLDTDMGVTNVPVSEGIKALLFGLVLGASGYMSGYAMASRSNTILQMVGLNGYLTSDVDKNYN